MDFGVSVMSEEVGKGERLLREEIKRQREAKTFMPTVGQRMQLLSDIRLCAHIL